MPIAGDISRRYAKPPGHHGRFTTVPYHVRGQIMPLEGGPFWAWGYDPFGADGPSDLPCLCHPGVHDLTGTGTWAVYIP